MKNNLLLLIISLLFIKVGFAQSNHTININGANDGWNGAETFTNCSSADNAYFTWDADYVYFGIRDAEADYGNLATFIYLDTDPTGTNGSNNAYTWSNNITTPFNADWVIVWKNDVGKDYIEIRKYNSTWDLISNANSTSLIYNTVEVVNFAIGTDYREVRIKRTLIDNPMAIKIASLSQQDYGSGYRYFAWPSNGWTDQNNGSGQSIPNYYGFVLKDQISQTNSPYYNADIKSFDGGTNGTGTDWSINTNWTSDVLPGNSTLTLIPGDKAVNIASNSTADAYDLVVNGTLTIKSDATGTGSLIASNAVAATVERYLTKYSASGDKMFHFISSPVSNQAISAQFSDPPNNSTDDFYKFDENTYKWINFRSATVDVPNSSFGESNFIVGRGYLVAYSADGIKTFTGTLNSGTLTSGTGLPALTFTSTLGSDAGWNLIGNPYPSAIDWDNVAPGQYTNMDNAVYVRDNANSTYKTWVDGIGTLTDGVIPAMQGFFVHANAASPSLFLENLDRVHGGTTYYKKSSVAENVIHLKVEGNERYDETIIRFTDEATTAFDGQLDAYKLYGGASVPTFYSKAGDTKLSVNSLPLSSMAGTVPLAVEAGAEATYTLSLEENSLSSAINVTLEDMKTGLLRQLNDQQSYTFTAAPGDDLNRFLLHFLNTTGTTKLTSSTIKVYSATGKINISGVDGKAEILIRNIMGQVVLRNSVNGSTLQSLNTGNLPSSVYVVSVVSASKTVSQKVVVK